MELTEKQKKTLQRFSLYCQSQGAQDEVTFHCDIQDTNLEFWNDKFYDSEGRLIEGYDTIKQLMVNIIESFETIAIDSMGDNENYGRIQVTININENSFTVDLYEELTETEQYFYENDISDSSLTAFDGLKRYMKEQYYDVAELTFEGSGDDGYLYDQISFKGDNGSGRTSFSRNFSVLEDYFYDKLEETLPGWENDDGSQGKFTIDLLNNKCYLHMGVNTRNLEHTDVLGRFEF